MFDAIFLIRKFTADMLMIIYGDGNDDGGINYLQHQSKHQNSFAFTSDNVKHTERFVPKTVSII